jgi:hypothetical protein
MNLVAVNLSSFACGGGLMTTPGRPLKEDYRSGNGLALQLDKFHVEDSQGSGSAEQADNLDLLKEVLFGGQLLKQILSCSHTNLTSTKARSPGGVEISAPALLMRKAAALTPTHMAASSLSHSPRPGESEGFMCSARTRVGLAKPNRRDKTHPATIIVAVSFCIFTLHLQVDKVLKKKWL